MSRAFVREEDTDHAGTSLVERPRSSHINYVTAFGWSQLNEQFLSLMARRAELSQRDDMESKQQSQAIERDLRYFQDRLESAILVDPKIQSSTRAHFGSVVELRDDDDQRLTFQIVGEDEADAGRGKISWVSPLAKVLLDAEVGDRVVWRRPVGDKELELVAIRPQPALPGTGQ